MAKEYNIGDRLYLPVWVTEKETNVMMGPDKSTTITDAKFSYTYCLGRINTGKVRYGKEGLLLTAEEIYASRRVVDEVEHLTDMLDYGRKKYDEIEELKSRNAELEALLKEVMATRDEAIKQNNELIAENKKLKADCNEWKDTANERLNAVQTLSEERNKVMAVVDELKNTLVDRTNDVQHLTEENEKLKSELDQRNKDFWAMKKDRDELDSIGGKLRAENDNLKAWYEEANKTASEAAEANDELKAKIAELRDEVATLKAERCSLNGQVGKNLAEIQALSSDVHFFKEACKKQKAECDELKGRYDELDSVNKEQAEKIRKLDAERDTWERNAKAWKMTADGMSKGAEELQAENEKLNNRNKYLESEKNRKPIVHVLTNDGHVYAFTSSGKVSVKYHTELNILMIEDGEKTIAGFSRGDKPGNLSAWWMG